MTGAAHLALRFLRRGSLGPRCAPNFRSCISRRLCFFRCRCCCRLLCCLRSCSLAVLLPFLWCSWDRLPRLDRSCSPTRSLNWDRSSRFRWIHWVFWSCSRPNRQPVRSGNPQASQYQTKSHSSAAGCTTCLLLPSAGRSPSLSYRIVLGSYRVRTHWADIFRRWSCCWWNNWASKRRSSLYLPHPRQWPRICWDPRPSPELCCLLLHSSCGTVWAPKADNRR